MKTLETLANEILHKLNFETHKSTTQIVVEGLIEAQGLAKLCTIPRVVGQSEQFKPFEKAKGMCKKCLRHWCICENKKV